MLLEESEEEDPQMNFEINSHRSNPITLEESHSYRNEINDTYFEKSL